MSYRLSIIILLRASDQKAIEHGNSDALVAMRHELVECYALAFRVVTELESMLSDPFSSIFFRSRMEKSLENALEKVEQQNKRFESLMKLARPPEPSIAAALLGEMRGCVQTLEEGTQKRLEEAEQHIVASDRDILPAIIREELRKLLVEQKDSVGLDHRSC